MSQNSFPLHVSKYYIADYRYLKVSLVPSVSPTNWSFTSKTVPADSGGESPIQVNDNFPVAVPRAKLSTKTLQITIWTHDPEVCVGSAQISLADFDWESVHVRWYNVLGLQFSMLSANQKTPITSNSLLSSHQSTLKEESSDDSTIISSQASTLTRNIEPVGVSLYPGDDPDDIVIPSEPCKAFDMNSFLKTVDMSTNTDYAFVQPSSRTGNSGGNRTRPKVKEVVKRSKTFSPKDAQDKYSTSVKLNRSDSDGAMPLYRKLPFQHKISERRSLRLPTKLSPTGFGAKVGGADKAEDERKSDALATKLQMKRSRRLARTKEHMMETSLDLELDLAAQRTKLVLLQSDLSRLRDIQLKLEDAKAQGGQHESWNQDHEYLEKLLSKVCNRKQPTTIKRSTIKQHKAGDCQLMLRTAIGRWQKHKAQRVVLCSTAHILLENQLTATH